MWVHRSNRLEELARALGQLLSSPGGDPLAPGTVVVLSQGMERWLGMTLAQQLGIAAGLKHPFPAGIVHTSFEAVLGDAARGVEGWRPERLTWNVLRALSAAAQDPDLAPIAAYLHDDPDEPVSRRRMQLARTLADVLDRAVTYRPDVVLQWEDGPIGAIPDDQRWHAALWRHLVPLVHGPHTAALARAFSEAISSSDGPIAGLPDRLFVFGVTALPPFYLDVLSALSRRVEVHLLVLCPSRAWWGHIRDRRAIARELRRTGAPDASSLHLEEGHPLLASLGRLGRDFQLVLEGSDAPEPYRDAPGDLFVDPGTATTLAALQSDILHLRHRSAPTLAAPPDAAGPTAPNAEPPLERDPCDGTVRLHACHGHMRQVEVLYEDLLTLFTELPDLTPRDVVVMTPDVEEWAPLIDAVFGAGEPRLPYRIVDRSLGDNPAADALLRTLALAGLRAEAPAILDLLSLDAVRARFGIAAEELSDLVGYVADSGIRWGIDAAHRAEHGQPSTVEHTWRFGLDRLLLGWAMEPDPAHLFAGVLPMGGLEGSGADLVGRFSAACEALFGALASLRAPRSMGAWAETLGGLLDTLVCPRAAGQRSVQQVRDVLTALADDAGGASPPLSFEAARALVEARLGASGGAGGLLSGEVTFAALVPMRSIPFRVVCLLGLDDAAFPRRVPRSSLDLLAQAPRVGDRSPREDDRTMFLEAILAARDRLVVTWTGRDPRDDRHLPPCGPVLELLDTLVASFAAGEPPETTRERLVRTHPLHPFSPRAFGVGTDGPIEPWSHDVRHLAGARALLRPREEPPPFVTGVIPLPPADGERVITLEQLIRFLQSPLRAWLTDRLGVRPLDDGEALDEREPIELDSLESWGLRDRLLAWTLDGLDGDTARDAARASGLLPHGTPGDCLTAEALAEAAPIAAAVRELRGGALLDPAEVDVVLSEGLRLVGRVARFPGGLVAHQAGKIRARHELALWVRHLALHVASPACPGDSHLAAHGAADGGAAVVRLRSLSRTDAQAALATLSRLWLEGQTAPLPFAPETSRVYAEAVERNPDAAEQALSKAQLTWEKEADEHAARVLGDASLLAPLPGVDLDEDFASLASAVWGPLLAHREEP